MNIGIDIISIDKFRRIKVSDFRYWRHVFTEQEWKYAFTHKVKSAERLAGTFAAKEAAMKAAGKTSIKSFRKFLVLHKSDGAPRLNLSGYKLSISHDSKSAVAVVIKCNETN